MSRHPAVDLLAVVLRQLPVLPGALCRNRSELFDSEDPADVAAAVNLCGRCPALADCRAWIETLSYQARPPGTIAARHYRPRRPRGEL